MTLGEMLRDKGAGELTVLVGDRDVDGTDIILGDEGESAVLC